MSRSLLTSAIVLLLSTGCSGSGDTPGDAGGGTADAARVDAGTDAAWIDAGADASSLDAGAPDAAPDDAGPADDAATPDAGPDDAATDAAIDDAGIDAGTDAGTCGDGAVGAGEECDLGSRNGMGEGCEADCTWTCVPGAAGDAACDDGDPCSGVETCADTHVCAAGTPEADGTSCGLTRACRSGACVEIGTTCDDAIAVAVSLGAPTTVLGTTEGGGSHTGSGCDTSPAPDRVYRVTAASAGFLTAHLLRATTDFDSVLYVATGCAEGSATPTLLCHDSFDPIGAAPLDGGEVVSLRVTAGASFYLIVDGATAWSAGAFELSIDLSDGASCTDPVPLPVEAGTPFTVLGSNTSMLPRAQGTCGGLPGGEVVYAITAADARTLSIATDAGSTSYNSVLYARSTCATPTSELACSNLPGTSTESITVGATAGAPIYLYVDGSQTGGGVATGSYGVVITP